MAQPKRRWLILLLISFATTAMGQSTRAQQMLTEGVQLFSRALFANALTTFRGILLEEELLEYHRDAYVWLGKSYLALKSYDEAQRHFQEFLDGPVTHPLYAEGLYQLGRASFLLRDYEGAIQLLNGFIRDFPESEFVANAYYWSAESMFNVGLLQEARRVFMSVARDFPDSAKVEAARYRVSIIDFRRRENELLKLLRWSHEEMLKTVEEFQRRERDYELAATALQRRIAEFEQEDLPALIVERDRRIADLQASLAALRETQTDLQEQLAAAQVRITELSDVSATAASSSAEVQAQVRLLAIKERALRVQQELQDWVALQEANQ